MARAGRKRKSGQRTKSGALKRIGARVEPCEGVQRRRAAYAAAPVYGINADGEREMLRPSDGSQTFDAIGRAWSAGLLGYRADEMRDGARVIASQYWRVYGFHTPDSLARFQPSGGVGVTDSDRERIIEAALNDGLAAVAKRGRDVRRAFDMLVIDLNPDHGPDWLDRIIFAKRTGRAPEERDSNMLRLAIEGLQEVA